MECLVAVAVVTLRLAKAILPFFPSKAASAGSVPTGTPAARTAATINAATSRWLPLASGYSPNAATAHLQP